MSSSVDTQSNDWSRDTGPMPPFDPDTGPPPDDSKAPWYRWAFSIPFTIFVILFFYLIYLSSQSDGTARTVYLYGAGAAVVFEILIVAVQFWDRYPYRMHRRHHDRAGEQGPEEAGSDKPQKH